MIRGYKTFLVPSNVTKIIKKHILIQFVKNPKLNICVQRFRSQWGETNSVNLNDNAMKNCD